MSFKLSQEQTEKLLKIIDSMEWVRDVESCCDLYIKMKEMRKRNRDKPFPEREVIKKLHEVAEHARAINEILSIREVRERGINKSLFDEDIWPEVTGEKHGVPEAKEIYSVNGHYAGVRAVLCYLQEQIEFYPKLPARDINIVNHLFVDYLCKDYKRHASQYPGHSRTGKGHIYSTVEIVRDSIGLESKLTGLITETLERLKKEDK